MLFAITFGIALTSPSVAAQGTCTGHNDSVQSGPVTVNGCAALNNNCSPGYTPILNKISADPSCSTCTCGKASKPTYYHNQHNCAADCMSTVKSANDMCYNTDPSSCLATNPYGQNGSCGYGTIKSKKNKKCPACIPYIPTCLHTV